MSELVKLEEEYRKKGNKIGAKLYKEFLFKMVTLKADCEHKKTHWLQEMNREGVLSEKLVKRCFICGQNVEEITFDKAISEQILNQFDCNIEQQKQLTSSNQTVTSNDNTGNKEES
jgi:hypothetical protein